MEKKTTSNLLSSELITILIVQSIISFLTRFLKLSSRFLSLNCYSSRDHVDQVAPKSHLTEATRAEQEIFKSREAAELVMRNMGLIGEDEQLRDLMVSEEVSTMFEDKEPSFEEVKEAFAVFDENGDGFVEAGELQRVLCKLGFVREVGLDLCKEMIFLHDKDGDGRIDFGDFVKLMESCFC
ncbi:probable calcium-binding protein CML30 [Dendrobium catenatum]|uniref:Putative calcium-binding protein CML30 n=1 Tax=Dendrobium catenatum TaxID=906689 RepID=A0A2I0VHK8_9ASPA|nr:probable calcium-binding protein CML30 [Dendrobium catenatum]PKU62906.1 putative calcium-binding protein CML30 [Dendrobium catenatum]